MTSRVETACAFAGERECIVAVRALLTELNGPMNLGRLMPSAS